MPTYTPKQVAAISRAPPEAKAAMRKTYQEQKVKANSVPKARARPTANAPRAKQPQRQASQALPNYMDPMCKAPMPASLSDGKALAHTSLVSVDFKLPKYEATGTPARFPGPSVLLVTNTGGTATVGVLVQTSVVEGGNTKYLEEGIKQQLFNIPTLSTEGVGGHPTAGRAMKFGVSVVNNTNALKRGGRVTYLNTFQRLPDLVVGGSPEAPNYYWDNVITAVKAAPDRRRINGDNLVFPKQLIGAVVDNVRYHEFNRWKPTESKLEFLEHVLDREQPEVSLGYVGNSTRSMTTVAYVFEPTDDAQDYSITIRAAYYTRWPLTSVPGQSMSPIPTASHGLLNAVHEHVASKVGDLVGVMAEGATGAAIAEQVPATAAANALWNRFVASAKAGAAAGEAAAPEIAALA